MRLAYFDCPSGASGDMVLGALVDAGCQVGELETALASLKVDGWHLEATAVERGGLHGTHLAVRTDPARRFRTLGDMLEPIERSTLSDGVKTRAGAVLRRLAEAEARVHRVPVDAVHFHEVGDLDTLVDVVGSVAGLDALGVERVHVSPLPIGGGTVQTAHGRLPVPAPATAELLRGFPVYDNGISSELVTPTGAAILTTLGTPDRLPAMTLERIGWGAGVRELPVPNLLRVLVGQTVAPDSEPGEIETLVSIETTIDDMSPQLYEPLVERLLAAGALDVHLAPVVMKRSRPGTVLSALAAPELADRLADLLVPRDDDDRGTLERGPPPPASAGAGARPDDVGNGHLQDLEAGRPRRDGDARVRGGAPDRRRAAATGPRGAGGGATGGIPGDRIRSG